MSSRRVGPSADTSGLMPAEERSLVHQLTHDILAATAPEELSQFEASASQYLDHPGHKIEQKSDDMLGSALDIIVPLTPYVVAAATEVVHFIVRELTDAAEAEFRPVIVRWVRHLFHRESAVTPPPPLPAGLVERVHDIALGVCRDLGADQGDAAVVADAIAGRLITAPA